MRRTLLPLAFLCASACQPAGPSPELQQLQAACAGGNLQACATVEQMRQQAQMAAAAFYGNMQAPQATFTPITVPQMRTPVQTRCSYVGSQYVCNSY
jgi:hypothetical protein